MKPDFSILVPSLGEGDYLRMFLSSLQEHATQRYEVQIHVFPRERLPALPAYDFPVLVTSGDTPGLGYASNVALSRARGEWLIWLNDDMVFLPGFDDFDGRLHEKRVLCWDLLEPIQGSFPPPCYAGRHPKEFQKQIAVDQASLRKTSITNTNFFGTFIFHRSLLTSQIRWSEDTGAYSTADIDLPYRLFLEHQNVVFGRLGLSLYHFVSGSITRNPWLRLPGEEAQRLFVNKFGVTTGEAYQQITRRSSKQWF